MLILASASPRRKELLEQIDCTFTCMEACVEEIQEAKGTPEALAIENALRKAMAVSIRPEAEGQPVLGADTVVCYQGEIFGKPKDQEDAKYMLGLLSGNRHQVCTGIALVINGKTWTKAVTTEVVFADLTKAEIEAYAACGEPFDKAGSYAIQGRAAAFIKEIHGCYTNVVGLPLQCLTKLAEEAGLELR